MSSVHPNGEAIDLVEQALGEIESEALVRVLRAILSETRIARQASTRAEEASKASANAVAQLRVDFDGFGSKVDVLTTAALVAQDVSIESEKRVEAAYERIRQLTNAKLSEVPSAHELPSNRPGHNENAFEAFESDSPSHDTEKPPESE